MTSRSMRDLAAQMPYMRSMVELVRAQAQAAGNLASEPIELDTYGDDAVAEATPVGTALRCASTSSWPSGTARTGGARSMTC